MAAEAALNLFMRNTGRHPKAERTIYLINNPFLDKLKAADHNH